MAASSDVVVRLRAVGQQAFKSAMDSAATSVTGVGKAPDRTEKEVAQSTRAAQRAGPSWRRAAKGVATFAGGAAALYAAKRGIQSAVTSTLDLAKSTIAIERATGLDTQTASAWVEMTKVRGINTKAFQMSLVKLSKTMDAARTGNDKALATLFKYGVSLKTIGTGDTGAALTQLADGFAAIKSPAEKAALAQSLFGRGGQALLPLMQQGSAGIQEQMDLVQRYGATIANTDDAKKMLAQQKEMRYAMDGLKISLGQGLIPIIKSLAEVLLSVVRVLQPLLRDSTALKLVIGGLAAAFVYYRLAVMAATIAQAGMMAVWALIPLAIAAIVVGVVMLYKRWGWFHRAVDNTWRWIKKNWPLLLSVLLGPFGIAIALIVRNFGKLKSAARTVASVFPATFATIKSVAGSVIGWLVKRVQGLVDLVKHVVSTIKGLPGKAWSKITGRQAGGVVRAGEITLVGERGPELMQLPGGSRITPLASPRLAMAAPSLGAVATTAHFYLDRRLVGTAVARDTADRKARR
jgi:hypothetical protein